MYASRPALLLAALAWSVSAQAQSEDPPSDPVRIVVDVSEVPELAEWAEKSKGQCQEWYPRICELLPSEGFTPPQVVTITFKQEMPGIAGTSRSRIDVSARWVLDHPDDFGMVIHELTHVVQFYPKYDPVWLIEGLADYIRYYHFEPHVEHPRPDPERSSFRDGYHMTAAFLAWIERNHDAAIIQQLNQALRATTYQDQLFQDRTGKDLDTLWKEYLMLLPTTGHAVSELAAFDDCMQRFMAARAIPAGTLAVSKGGRLLLARGYGHADADRQRLVQPDDPFRIASVTKPITAAAVRTLIREGKLAADTPAFALLDLSPPPGQEADPRLAEITIEHLLRHQGGWDRDAAFDPMFRPLEIADALGTPRPAASQDVIRYMLGQPLQFDPGERASYSNFGYCVLGRVIEKLSGQSYFDYLQESILQPLQMESVALARSLPADRHPREPVYWDPGREQNVFAPEGDPVPSADGAFHLEAMDAHGGLIASSIDLAKFLDAYWLTGEPRSAEPQGPYLQFGSLPGTFSMVLERPDGLNLAVLFNQRTDPSGLDYVSIRAELEATADSIKEWSAR